MDKNREIYAILSGRVSFVNGAYTAASSAWKTTLTGTFNGADSVRLFGVSQMVRHYQSDSADAAVYAAKNVFGKLGRSVRFQSEPGLQACFLRSYLGNPIILTLEEAGDGILVNAYTARTMFAGTNLRHAFQVFEKHLPDDLPVALMHDEQARNKKVPRMQESRKERRAKKKAEKLEKRAERINAKAQAAAEAVSREDE